MTDKNRQIITGHDNEIRINNRESIPLGVQYIVSGEPDKQGNQTAYFSLTDQKRPKWFVIDLETGDNWLPEEDTELQQWITIRDTYIHTDPLYIQSLEQIERIYSEHPSFIRKTE